MSSEWRGSVSEAVVPAGGRYLGRRCFGNSVGLRLGGDESLGGRNWPKPKTIHGGGSRAARADVSYLRVGYNDTGRPFIATTGIASGSRVVAGGQ